jgi:TDG/mug DNA glycosylase family protein
VPQTFPHGPACAAAHKPTRAEILAAANKTVPDVLAPGLKVLFCGINPGLYTAAVGHHFARPGNRFWPALHEGGFTPRVLSPYEERELLPRGYGITNVVPRATASADELSAEEFAAGGRCLLAKVRHYRPRLLAVLGIGAYRSAFGRPRAALGLQPETVGETKLWVLPNPSGLNAHYGARDLGRMFRALREAVEADLPSV